ILYLSTTHDVSGIFSHKMSVPVSRLVARLCYNNNIDSQWRFLIMLIESLAVEAHGLGFIL
ncbi:hypothetical protein QUH46_17350, partial [Klebsiella grimontii]|uniref:hypothetical protein n=1 Tax=Klebsiella grimontii TaxID=2058152 RepID=UPI0025A2792C